MSGGGGCDGVSSWLAASPLPFKFVADGVADPGPDAVVDLADYRRVVESVFRERAVGTVGALAVTPGVSVASCVSVSASP